MGQKLQVAEWDREYTKGKTYTSTSAKEPSPSFPVLLSYLKSFGKALEGNVLDVGCGVGRNAIPLAEMGLDVYGTEVSQEALTIIRAEIIDADLENTLHVCFHDMTTPFPFDEQYFDFVLDITSSTNVWNIADFRCYIDRLANLCRKGGYVFLVGFHESDEYCLWLWENHRQGDLIRSPTNNVLSKVYTDEEVREAASMTEKLELRHYEMCKATNEIRNQTFQRRYNCYLWERR